MLQIRLLGQFDVRLGGKRVLIPSRAGQSLLAYLVLTAGTPHRREKLGGILWPDFSDDNARKNLRHELWRIRKAISTQQSTTVDYLLAEEFTIAFNREADYWLDAAQIERPELDLGSLISNLSLYQGELLPGFYEDWIVLERERIRRIFDAKMEQLLAQLIAVERWTAVQEQAERWLSLGNTLEPAYRALMLAYGSSGDMAKVSSIYQRCMDELNEQFGLEPSAETRALYDGLLKGAHIPSRAVQSSGTVTFLFTDIEESTNLLDKLGEQYATVLAEHHKIMRDAVQKWNGREVETQGDAFFVTFARSLDAVQCACEAQRALASHSWLQNQPLRVRMGLHTGEPLIASTGYVGMDVHRAARIGDAAHGGQVLLSQTTRELVSHDLPKGVTIRDLGEHRLKDLKFPTPIYQLVIEGLPHNFPPLRTKFTGVEAPTPGDPPFKGLQYFEETDSDLFFGRELLTAKLVNRLRETEFLSVVIGASGSGKSSLVRAGLIPALKKGEMLPDGTQPPEGSAAWRVYIITPTAHPLQALATDLTRESESVTATATLMDDLMQDPRSLTLFLARQNRQQHTLLLVDQFEELFTLCRDEFEREAFIDNLLTTLNQSEGNITLILTLRADFYAHLAQYPELREAVARQQEYIGPMTTDELRRAIEEPAKRGHWVFEPGLVDLILRDVGDEPGALPLLSHALLETWKRRAGHTLTLKGYADAGGVRGAIAHTAESVYQNLSTEEQSIARNIFLRLTELGEGTEDTRRRSSFEELISYAEDADEARAVLNILAEARLVTLGEDTAEVAHEALIREWPTLREWLNQDRESLRLHRHLTESAHEWELLERDTGALYRGAHLAQAREWAALHPNALNSGEKAFLEASNALEQGEVAEREAQRQRELEAAQKLAATERAHAEEQTLSTNRLRTRNRVITTVGSIAIILAIVASLFGSQANQNATLAQQNLSAANIANTQSAANAARAESESRIAQARELAGYATANLDTDAELSTLLALQAVSVTTAADGGVLPEAESILHRSVEALHSPLMTIRASQGHGFSGAQWSPDGTRIVSRLYDINTGGPPVDGTPILDGTTGQLLYTLPGYPWGIYWTNDRIVTGNWSENVATLIRWDISSSQSARQLATIRVPFPPSRDLDWTDVTLDFRYFICVTSMGLTQVWDLTTGQEIATALTRNLPRYNVAPFFSRDGTLLALRNPDQTVSIIDTATWKEQVRLTGSHPGAEVPFTWSYDSKSLVHINRDGTVTVWNVTTGQEQYTVSTDLHVTAALLSKDGTRLATATADGQIILWDTARLQPALTIAVGGLNGLDFGFDISPDGTRLVTTSGDGTLKVWDLLPNRELLTLVNGAPGETGTTGLAYSPDGRRLVVSSNGDIPIVWDTKTGQKVFTLIGHTDQVQTAAWSPDGSLIASGGADHTAILWDARTGQKLLTLSGHTDTIYSMAFSPDSTRLATSSLDHSVAVWDVKTGKHLLTLAQPDKSKGVVWSSDGLRLAAGTENAYIHIWNSLTGEQQLEIPVGNSRVGMIAFSPDGARLAAGMLDFGEARVFDAKTGKKLMALGGNSDLVAGVAYSPDGKRIATAGKDGIIKLWDAATGQEQLTLYGPLEGFYRVIFSPDGARLATSGPDGTTRIYVLPLDELVALAKSRLTRSLTMEECQQYLHEEQCPASP